MIHTIDKNVPVHEHTGTSLAPYAYVDRLDLKEIVIPPGTKGIGRYAFYNCKNLEKLSFFSDIKDLGSGIFTGCHRINTLEVTLVPESPSCLRDFLMELSEELLVIIHGEEEARLHFPQYYEDSVENTPARILMIQTYGAGKLYRNCFVNRQLRFEEYDACFVKAKAHESDRFLTRLAFDRLWYPCKLGLGPAGEYKEYLKAHRDQLWSYMMEEKDISMIRTYLELFAPDEESLSQLTELTVAMDYPEARPCLMEYRRKHYGKKRKRFDLDF